MTYLKKADEDTDALLTGKMKISYEKSDFEKMRSGEYYQSLSAEILRHVNHARDLTEAFNHTAREEEQRRESILRELLGSTGRNISVNPPFTCDHGRHIHVGDHFFANYDCMILDAMDVRFGDNCMLGPRVCIYSVGHPLNSDLRSAGLAVAKPVTIGSHVWIGGNAVIAPGVTIGDYVVVAAGAVVTKDVPAGVLVGGNPAVIIKAIE